MTPTADMTNEEQKAAVIASLNRCLDIVKALFPSLVGFGLKELSGDQDQAAFNRAAQRIEGRLPEKNRDGVQYLDDGDRQLAEQLLHFYRRTFTR
ncbi:MAG: hypothetical protein ACTSPB_16450 [Candidatus Thorarchaeota archaeon]